MYRCVISGKLSKPGDKCQKLVVATRDKKYYGYVENEDGERERAVVGNGWEIVKEINVTSEGADLWNSWNDSDRSAFVATLGL